MSCKTDTDQQKELIKRKFILQRWLYAIVGILTMIPIILLTVRQIQTMNRDNNDFAIYLLLLVHSGCVIVSMIATALFCRITDGLLTTLTIMLLLAYTGIHFYMQFLFDYYNSYPKSDFTIVTLRLGFTLIMIIILIPWTCIITYSYRVNTKNEPIYSRSTIFSWFLNFDSMLIISLLTLNIRSQADFSRYQLLVLFIGIPLIFLWFLMGKIMSNNKSRNGTVWTTFYLLAILQFTHIAYITYWSKYEYDSVSKTNSTNLMPLLLITFICGGASVLVHFLTIIISFFLYRTY